MRTPSSLLASSLLALALTASAAASASATDPIDLGAGFVHDLYGALTEDEANEAEQRLGQTFTEARTNLFVVYVDRFTSPADAAGWANEVYDRNGLGPHQYLLAVAIEGQTYYIAAHIDGALSDEELTDIELAIQPSLSREDWLGAIHVAAASLESALLGPAEPSPSPAPPATQAPTSPPTTAPTPPVEEPRGAGAFWLVASLVGLGVVIFFIVRASRKRLSGPRALVPASGDPLAFVSDKDLERQAGSALVQTDDAVTASREDLGFAIAQFGDGATAAFTATVDDAAARLSQAFSLKQKLDDEIPDTAEQRRAWHIEIIALCQAASDLLDENVAAYDELRRLEQNAPEALEHVRSRRQVLEAKLSAAPDAIATLTATYSPAALGTVIDNHEQARMRIGLADRSLAEATAHLATGETGKAAFALRTAEEAVLQTGQLLDAIADAGPGLAAIEAQARALIQNLESDLVVAASLDDRSGDISAVAARTQYGVEQARSLLSVDRRDPQAVLASLDAANTEIDTTIARVRDALEQERRYRQHLEQRMLQAQTQVRIATDYITTRRGAIGAAARTRLAEAEAALSLAHSTQVAHPEQALQHASRAYELARQAVTLAEGEIREFQSSQSAGLGAEIIGGLLGGIISAALTGGGGSRGSSWGGSSRGGSSRSGWSASSSSGSRSPRSSSSNWRSSGGKSFSPSSFGGARSRSGGGRF